MFPPPRHVPDGQSIRPDPLGFGTPSVVTVPPPLMIPQVSPLPLPQIGDSVRKSFGHHGDFHGTIVAYDVNELLYQVTYTDGDQEELTLEEVLPLWDPSADDTSPSSGHVADATSVLAAPAFPHSALTTAQRRQDRREQAHVVTFAIPSALSPLTPVFVPPPTTPSVFDIDSQCQELVGCQFLCPLLGPCEVTHWDTDFGQHRLNYTSTSGRDHHQASLPEVQAWVRKDALPRKLAASTTLFWSKVFGLFGFPDQPPEIVQGSVRGLVSRLQTSMCPHDVSRWPLPVLSSTRMRLVLKAKETIFKYGVYVPKNDKDANLSPERVQWRAGRTLEWLRLLKIGKCSPIPCVLC